MDLIKEKTALICAVMDYITKMDSIIAELKREREIDSTGIIKIISKTEGLEGQDK